MERENDTQIYSNAIPVLKNAYKQLKSKEWMNIQLFTEHQTY